MGQRIAPADSSCLWLPARAQMCRLARVLAPLPLPGNQHFLAMSDVLHLTFVEGCVCMLKYHPLMAVSAITAQPNCSGPLRCPDLLAGRSLISAALLLQVAWSLYQAARRSNAPAAPPVMQPTYMCPAAGGPLHRPRARAAGAPRILRFRHLPRCAGKAVCHRTCRQHSVCNTSNPLPRHRRRMRGAHMPSTYTGQPASTKCCHPFVSLTPCPICPTVQMCLWHSSCSTPRSPTVCTSPAAPPRTMR